MSGVEDAVFKHAVQLEVRLYLRLVQIVLGLAHLFGIELPVPGLEGEPAMLRVDERLNVFGFAGGSRG